ncbi:hypothetical protein [Methylosinus sporium]|uniref:hypothetical protein n=1 Tax=Methylosinus sporium TaxID=428 RepID=UPI00383B7C6C
MMDSAFFATPRQLQALKSLQKLLIKEIVRAERKIRRSKFILKTLESVAPEKIAQLNDRIEGYRHVAYIWRCFGDAIAFLFMDKFALKQTFFNTHNSNAKQDAGFLADKEGLCGEWMVMEEFLAKGIPALLSDLTNTIRHGDVCVMIGPDPHLIEVKTGTVDRRGRRQKNSIRQLTTFFKTDEAEGLRGLGKVRRVVHSDRESVYLDSLNECIRIAMKNGAAWRSPENGLYYIAISDGPIGFDEVFAELKLTRPAVFFLNEFKARRSWSPYYPFTLSICDREALFRFIWGDICLVVIYDLDVLRRLAESEGVKIDFQPPGSECAFELTRTGDEGRIGLGSLMFSRLAFDFTSPAWLLREAIGHYDRHKATANAQDVVVAELTTL